MITKTGALLFAFNTGTTDYLKIAEFSARNIKRWLNIPTTVVTDTEFQSDAFDTIIVENNKSASKRYFDDYKSVVEWRNAGRHDAYNLTPYEQTLLLDVDYIVASDQLSRVLNSNKDFLCHDSAIEISGTKGKNTTFGSANMPMYWATVVMFRKTEFSKTVFDLMCMIENNFEHYANLFGFSKQPYRNDYALSIALSIASGHVINNKNTISWPMVNIHPEHEVKKIKTDRYEATYIKTDQRGQKMYRNIFDSQDMHVMSKLSLENILEAN